MAGTGWIVARPRLGVREAATALAGGFESVRVSICAAVARALLWISAALIAWTQAGYAVFLAVLAPAPEAPRLPAAGRRAPARVADRRRVPRGVRDRRQGRQRARARLAARPPRGGRRRRRRRRRDGRARPRGGRRRGARAAARRQGARPGRRGARRHRRAAGVLGRQRAVGAGRAARTCRRRSRTRGVGYACGRVAFVNEGGTNQEGVYWRYEMWMRGNESALASVTGRQRRDLRGAPARRTSRSIAVMGHDLSFPFTHGQARLARGRRPGRARDGEDGPFDRGGVAAQAAHDEPRVADRPARRAARSARLPAAVRPDDRLAPRAALRDAAAARRRAARHARVARPRPRAAERRRPRRRARRRRGRRARSRRGRCCCPLLRAHHRLAGRRPLRPPAPRHRRRAGTPRRARGDNPYLRSRRKRALDVARRGGRACCSPRPC